jgi:hypothetical protein
MRVEPYVYEEFDLTTQIEHIRDWMITLSNDHGLHHPQVLEVSRKLDALIITYHLAQRSKTTVS